MRRFLTILRTWFDAAAAFWLPPYGEITVTPVRMRDEHLVRILFFAGPILVFGFLLTVFEPFHLSAIARGLAVLLVPLVLILVKTKRSTAAVNLLFIGIMVLSVAAYALAVADGNRDAFSPLIAILIFSATVLVGLFSGSMYSLAAVGATGVAVDLFDWFFWTGGKPDNWYSHIGVIGFHLIAIALGRYLMAFFDRLSRLAEARRIMNRRLEELVGEVRMAGTARLESFSHDMRSPLTGIMGVHELLADTELDATQQKYLDILGKSIQLLQEVAESVLDHSDTPGTAAVGRLLDVALESYRAMARKKGVELKRAVTGDPPSLPLSRADASRVIANLVDNALKYTDSGSITVSVAAAPSATGRRLILSVADTGRGMSPERLLEIQSQAVKPDAAVASSHGLGLANVRRIIAEAGGTMKIESVVGRGTTVILRFPL